MADLFTRCSAAISDCEKYRYSLERQWSGEAPQVFVMLNPSTADAREDDPTIRRCIGFARREGAGGIIVVNLFAWRATDPAELDEVSDPFGPENAEHLGMGMLTAAVTMRPLICAWGACQVAETPAHALVRRAKDFDIELKCLGLTKTGAPRHPLYLPKNAPLIDYKGS